MRHPLTFVLPLLGPVLLLQLSACTLTSEPFNPEEVSADLSPSSDDDAPEAPDGMDGDGEPICSSTELGGCPLPVDASGEACATDLECESQVCASGRCAAASCTDGRHNGGEADVDCGGPCSEPCGDCGSDDCSPPEPTCDDRVLNQGEGDVDCGGPCERACEAGQRCGRDEDCERGFFCPPASGECTSVSCADMVQNGDELQTDCGGGTCPGCPIGAPCATPADCAEGVCAPNGTCAAPTCEDGVLNGDEPSTDCGGGCEACPPGETCSEPTDCDSRVCGPTGSCSAPSCNDGVQNGNEPSTDCGNAACGLCPNGRPCGGNAVCASGFCQAGICRIHPCTDNVQSPTETDVDCGGSDPRCRRCPDRDSCVVDADCASGDCENGICISCDDGQQNGGETAADCGGVCGGCAGAGCSDDDDCATGACEQGRCCGGAVADCTRCARRLATDVDCTSGGQAAANDCNNFLQCLANNIDDCETSTASECSDDEDDICFYGQFGGETGPGVTLAEAVLTDAGCEL